MALRATLVLGAVAQGAGAMRAATYPVHPEPFTVDDLYALPDDGMRHELVDGTLLVSPPPTVGHQRATTRLTLLLAAAASRELEVLEGTGVRLSSTRVLQPDMIVVSRSTPSPRRCETLRRPRCMSPSR